MGALKASIENYGTSSTEISEDTGSREQISRFGTSSTEISEDTGSGEQISRVDDYIVESIMMLKEPRGSSDRSAIAHYIEVISLTKAEIEDDFEKIRLMAAKDEAAAAAQAVAEAEAAIAVAQAAIAEAEEVEAQAEAAECFAVLAREMLNCDCETSGVL